MIKTSESNISDEEHYLESMLGQQIALHIQLMVRSNNETIDQIINGSFKPVDCPPEVREDLEIIRQQFLKEVKKSPIFL